MTSVVSCQERRTVTYQSSTSTPKEKVVVCQRFLDPEPIFFYYTNKNLRDAHIKHLTNKYPHIKTDGSCYFAKIESQLYQQVVDSNGILEGIHNPPLPCDQDDA